MSRPATRERPPGWSTSSSRWARRSASGSWSRASPRPAAEAEAAALELAADLAERPPDGLRLLKRMFREFEATADRVARENLLLETFQREGTGLPQG